MNEELIKLGNIVLGGFSTLGKLLLVIKKTIVVKCLHVFISMLVLHSRPSLYRILMLGCSYRFHIDPVLASLVSQLHCSKLDLPNFKKRVPCEIFVHISKSFQKGLRIQMTVESGNIQLNALQVLAIRFVLISPLVLYQWTMFFAFIVVWVRFFFTFIAIFQAHLYLDQSLIGHYQGL